MYLLMATSQNVDRIIRDFSGTQQYAAAHLFFIDGTSLPPALQTPKAFWFSLKDYTPRRTLWASSPGWPLLGFSGGRLVSVALLRPRRLRCPYAQLQS